MVGCGPVTWLFGAFFGNGVEGEKSLYEWGAEGEVLMVLTLVGMIATSGFLACLLANTKDILKPDGALVQLGVLKNRVSLHVARETRLIARIWLAGGVVFAGAFFYQSAYYAVETFVTVWTWQSLVNAVGFTLWTLPCLVPFMSMNVAFKVASALVADEILEILKAVEGLPALGTPALDACTNDASSNKAPKTKTNPKNGGCIDEGDAEGRCATTAREATADPGPPTRAWPRSLREASELPAAWERAWLENVARPTIRLAKHTLPLLSRSFQHAVAMVFAIALAYSYAIICYCLDEPLLRQVAQMSDGRYTVGKLRAINVSMAAFVVAWALSVVAQLAVVSDFADELVERLNRVRFQSLAADGRIVALERAVRQLHKGAGMGLRVHGIVLDRKSLGALGAKLATLFVTVVPSLVSLGGEESSNTDADAQACTDACRCELQPKP
jgi:hypothetical protein